ncbi:MAG: macro domain-containing protein [Oscillospiraceae bacterium]|nr:macro domain-containing protein [Oscillospiraceae bacterium]MBQ9411995.1 macro domain-containing protein [Oscillospiraceae bacterium]
MLTAPEPAATLSISAAEDGCRSVAFPLISAGIFDVLNDRTLELGRRSPDGAKADRARNKRRKDGVSRLFCVYRELCFFRVSSSHSPVSV